MKSNENIVEEALNFLNVRYIDSDGGVAVMQTNSGRLLSSTYGESLSDTSGLCHETGCICDAFKYDEKIITSVCVIKRGNKILFLPPCGVCQERLLIWGDQIDIIIPKKSNSAEWNVVKLKELQPYFWKNFL